MVSVSDERKRSGKGKERGCNSGMQWGVSCALVPGADAEVWPVDKLLAVAEAVRDLKTPVKRALSPSSHNPTIDFHVNQDGSTNIELDIAKHLFDNNKHKRELFFTQRKNYRGTLMTLNGMSETDFKKLKRIVQSHEPPHSFKLNQGKHFIFTAPVDPAELADLAKRWSNLPHKPKKIAVLAKKAVQAFANFPKIFSASKRPANT